MIRPFNYIQLVSNLMNRFKASCLLFIVVIVFTYVSAVSQNVDSSKSFFPLKIGNTWITSYPSALPPQPAFYKHQVIDSVRINDNLYYEVDLHGRHLFREDSLGHFYEYKDNVEHIIMDFTMSAGDSIQILNYLPGYSGYIYCLERKKVNTFIGAQDEQISFLMDWDSQIIDEEGAIVLQKGVGIFICNYFFDTQEYLRGVILDGVIYGDTTFVSVKSNHDNPSNFNLRQNYPNPFNPATTIEYTIPYNSNVTLKIYNTQGQEIETLVNQFQSAGNHSIKWKPLNITSGIYIYQLQFSRFLIAKKMLLLF